MSDESPFMSPESGILRDKPPDLCAIRDTAAQLFPVIKSHCKVDDLVELDLRDVDAARDGLFDHKGLGSFALRKLQALRFWCEPGVEAPLDPIVHLLADVRWVLSIFLVEASRAGDEEEIAIFSSCFDQLSRAVDSSSVLLAGVPTTEIVWVR